MIESFSPEHLARSGKRAYEQKKYQDAAKEFMAACHGYLTASDTLNAAEMANNASVAFLKAGNATEALSAVEGTEVTFLKSGDKRRQGIAIGNRAAALESLSRLPEAEEAYKQSIELLGEAGETDLRTFAIQSLSALQVRMGQHMEAVVTMQSSLEGVKHPSLKQRLINYLLKIPFKG
jgi:tetratricopeptide (TPR) repeat protein